MPESQDKIYYACGDTSEKIAFLPQTKAVISKGFDVLCFTDDVEEFAIRMLIEYEASNLPICARTT